MNIFINDFFLVDRFLKVLCESNQLNFFPRRGPSGRDGKGRYFFFVGRELLLKFASQVDKLDITLLGVALPTR